MDLVLDWPTAGRGCSSIGSCVAGAQLQGSLASSMGDPTYTRPQKQVSNKHMNSVLALLP